MIIEKQPSLRLFFLFCVSGRGSGGDDASGGGLVVEDVLIGGGGGDGWWLECNKSITREDRERLYFFNFIWSISSSFFFKCHFCFQLVDLFYFLFCFLGCFFYFFLFFPFFLFRS